MLLETQHFQIPIVNHDEFFSSFRIFRVIDVKLVRLYLIPLKMVFYLILPTFVSKRTYSGSTSIFSDHSFVTMVLALTVRTLVR